MACCGPNIPRKDKETLIKELRGETENIGLVLNKVEMIFEPENLRWKSNFYLLFIFLINYQI